MQRLEISCAVRRIYTSLYAEGLISVQVLPETEFSGAAFFHLLSLGLFTTIFFSELLSRFVSRCGSAVLYSFMVHAWWCFTKSSPCGLPEQWIGRGGPTAWSALSSALNRLHFCLRRHQCFQDLQQPIQNGFEMFHRAPGIFHRARQTLITLAPSCEEAQGGRTFWAFSLTF